MSYDIREIKAPDSKPVIIFKCNSTAEAWNYIHSRINTLHKKHLIIVNTETLSPFIMAVKMPCEKLIFL